MHKFTFVVLFVAIETRWNLRTAASDWIHVHKFMFLLCLCTAWALQRADLSKFGSFQNRSVCFWSPRRKQKLWGWNESASSSGNPLPSAGLPRPRHAEPRRAPPRPTSKGLLLFSLSLLLLYLCMSHCPSVCLPLCLSVCLSLHMCPCFLFLKLCFSKAMWSTSSVAVWIFCCC